jgi:hypothetical protein
LTTCPGGAVGRWAVGLGAAVAGDGDGDGVAAPEGAAAGVCADPDEEPGAPRPPALAREVALLVAALAPWEAAALFGAARFGRPGMGSRAPGGIGPPRKLRATATKYAPRTPPTPSAAPLIQRRRRPDGSTNTGAALGGSAVLAAVCRGGASGAAACRAAVCVVRAANWVLAYPLRGYAGLRRQGDG